MGMKKIKKLIRQEVSEGYSRGWDEGWDQGWLSAYNNEELRNELFNLGVHAERNRIIGMFDMLYKMNMEQGSTGKAKAYYDAAAMVRVADELTDHTVDEEGYAVDMEED